MRRLIDARLFGAGLVPVDTPALVQRYNECLTEAAIQPTELPRFQIDGMGWSPQIADEKQDVLYLSHGDANRLAIILTPDQERKPIYFMSRSFDRRLMELFFSRNREAIVDLTARTGLWLDLDVELSHYRSPQDLLLIRHIVVRTFAGEITEQAREQQTLVRMFTHGDRTWFDAGLRGKLIASARRHGDLRSRRCEIPDMRFDDLQAFYTRAFGGVFVLRGLESGRSVLALDDASRVGRVEPGPADAFTVDDPALLDRLYEEGLIEIDMQWYRNHPRALSEKLDYLVGDLLCHDDPELDFLGMSSARRKKRLVRLREDAPPVLHELERLIKHIESNLDDTCPLPSKDLQQLLLHPAEGLPDSIRGVVWQLLCRMQGHDLMRSYVSDKNYFFQQYQTWPDSKREWAVGLIAERYVPLMDQ